MGNVVHYLEHLDSVILLQAEFIHSRKLIEDGKPKASRFLRPFLCHDLNIIQSSVLLHDLLNIPLSGIRRESPQKHFFGLSRGGGALGNCLLCLHLRTIQSTQQRFDLAARCTSLQWNLTQTQG